MNREELETAARLAQGRTPDAARPLVARALAVDPHDADALTLLGLIAQRGGDRHEALDAFARARIADPDNPVRLGNHGVALKQAGRHAEAIAAFERALVLRPGAAVTLANLGSGLIAADRVAEAEAPLRAAIAAGPDHVEAWNNLGVALARTGRRDEAIAAYRRTLALRPAYVEAALNLADVLGDEPEAEAIATRVLGAQPGHPRAANLLAARHERRGDMAAAIALYRDAFGREPNPAIGINLAMALLKTGRVPEALALADRLLALTPAVTAPLALKYIALERSDARGELDRLLSLDRFVQVIDLPDDTGFHAALEAELRAHPSLTYEPEGLVTRSGRQSDDLARAATPAIAALADIATNRLADRHAALAGDDHPWLRARPDRWSLTLWGTILTPGGAVDPHIHAPNWLSGVYYPALPETVVRADDGGFAIGAFPDALGGGGTHHVHAPRPGRMILFPSWMWHATLPFGGAAERVSFAFDLVPEGIGRPHRLSRG
jgi:tetratricopeptide (TPR) repeat protein